MAAALETGKPIEQAQFEIEAGFKKIKTLKPNLLTIYTQIPQALNLLEQGEGWAIPSMFSTNVIPKEKESPMKMSAPKEGIFVGPAGVCMVKGGPNPEMAAAFIDMMLGAEMQDKLQPETFAFPSNVAAKPPVGIPADIKVHNLDWGFVAKERGEWVKRWDREMAM
jgi:putative spermidine/putrescine transport system substrate-binding protein